MITKFCLACNQERTLSSFVKRNDRPGYTAQCKDCRNARDSIRRCFDKRRYKTYTKSNSYQRNYYHNNKDRYRAYRQKSKPKRREFMRIWARKEREENPQHRIKGSLYNRVYAVVARGKKSAKTLELLGCSAEKLMNHLASKFKPGMTWENYGEWHMDHIRPCASFDLTKPDQQRICFNYQNLQPLWRLENYSKGAKY